MTDNRDVFIFLLCLLLVMALGVISELVRQETAAVIAPVRHPRPVIGFQLQSPALPA